MSEEKISKYKIIKDSTKELILTSTFQGLPNLIRTKRLFFKVIWFISLLVSSSACVYYETKTILDYFDYEVMTNIETINEPNAQFPTISICNQFNKDFEFKNVGFFFNFFDYRSNWKDHIEVFNDYVYGKCYRFNSGKDFYNNTIGIKNIGSSDYLNSLFLDLYVDSDYSHGYSWHSYLTYFSN